MTIAVFPGLVEDSYSQKLHRFRVAMRMWWWLLDRWKDIATLVPVLGIVGAVHAIGMSAWPPLYNDDEGTYMAQAWAVQTGRGPHHGLAQYTYWYDHPPLGWIQLAGLTWLTRTYRAGTNVVTSGRSLMLIYALVSAFLVYVIARRLGCSQLWAGIGVATFGLSPLSVDFLRLVFLDCIGLPWVLAAFALALSPKKRPWTHALSGACFAAGVLSKETFLVLLPAIIWQAWRGTELRTRRMSMTLFAACLAAVLAYYPLYAALKGELFSGKGHVSLIGSALWQLNGRAGSGSVFSDSSASHAQVLSWLHSDPWLVGLGLVCLPVVFWRREFRPIALGFVLFCLMLLRKGYLPNGFVVGALPFAALLISGGGSAVSQSLLKRWRQLRAAPKAFAWFTYGLRLSIAVVVASLLVWHVTPEWKDADQTRMSTASPSFQPIEQAEHWVNANIPKSSTLLVDDDVWTDLVDDGFSPSRVIWVYKLDLDPAVARIYPKGWRDMDFVVETPGLHDDITGDPLGTADPLAAVKNSKIIATFGSGDTEVRILKVQPTKVPVKTPKKSAPSYFQ